MGVQHRSCIQLWDSTLHSKETHKGILKWHHVPSHQDIPGNETVNDLVEAGRLQNPLNFEQPFLVLGTPDDTVQHIGDA